MNTIKVGLIPAAGAGTRMGYLSKILPKCLTPLLDKPAVHYTLEHMKKVGVEKVYVIVNYKKELVFEYLEEVKESLGLSIEYLYQKELKGIANAIMLAKDKIKEPFITILGDDCTLTDSLQKMVDSFYKNKAVVVEGAVNEESNDVLSRTCSLKLGLDKRIINITEKPKNPDTNIRGCGIYLFSPEIFKFIENTPVSSIKNEVEISDTIQKVAKDINKAYAYMIEGENININTNIDLLNALLKMHSRNSKT
jgi:dTDP-glucose pyrophosphorylase